ncbi:X-linked retinitis pigmentosa GTPase regulator-interacting protein 1 [Emydura macquarii macquarii]|uniref:X-linked retinitis pigmentosa GTPase regulator-interacting protein 1 n=1 Tax=Emydura macquarii macquarii TaxID=1129001 RepID=UPI00352A26F5
MSLLLLDETAGDLPVRDSSPKPSVITAIQDMLAVARPTKAQGLKTRMSGDLEFLPDGLSESAARTRQHVSQVNRLELEDGFLRLHDENLVLKEFACKQEDRIKRLGTKLLRLTQERAQVEGQPGSRARWSGRDLEESLEELQEQVQELERRNKGLRSRLLSYKQQLQLHGCRHHCPYSYVQPRVDTGLWRTHTADQRVPEKRHRGMQVHHPGARPTHPALPPYKDCITEGVQAEREQLCVPPPPSTTKGATAPESQLSHTLVLAELEPESQCVAWGSEMDHEGAQSQQHHQQALEHRAAIRGNVEQIRLQRLLRERSCELAVTKGRFADLQEAYENQLQQNQTTLRTTSDALLAEVEELTVQLKAERQKVTALESQLERVSSLQGALEEFQERLRHLEKERDLLKEEYDKLLESTLDGERHRCGAQQQGAISRLEDQLSLELAEKRRLVEELAQERAQSEVLKQEVTRRLLAYPQEVERGAILANQTPEQMPQLTPSPSQPPCLDRLPAETQQELGNAQRLHETEAAHADTVLELEKTRDMLILQHRINRDYQAELEGVMVQAEQEKRGHEEKQQKMVQLLDLRSARIRQLEEHLKAVVYGAGQRPVLPAVDDMDVEAGNAPLLQPGENLFELHIARAVLSGEALRLLGDVQPVTFCTYSFYNFETHCTPLVRGAQPRYSFTSQYVVQAEPLLLQYLQGATAHLDLHLATATDHSTLASCWLRFGEVLWSRERVHATAVLHGPSDENYGILQYWVRLHLPMEQTMRLHRERTQASGYLSACMLQDRAAPQRGPQDKKGVLAAEWMWNELQVQIGGCTGLRGRWLGTQPSPYAMYRFFTFPDHDTPIVPSSNNPQFGDLQTFPMRPTAELDRYLRLESLWVYIFDDEDAEPGRYLGKAQIPLLPLAHGHSIAGDFVLTDPAGHPNGSISLSLAWRQRYLPPGAALRQAALARDHQRDRPWQQLIEEERAALHSQPTCQREKLRVSAAKADGHTGKRGRRDEGASGQTQPSPATAFSGHAPEAAEEVAPVGERKAPEPAPESSSDAQTDSDEIVVGTSLGSPPKLALERIRIEILSLSLHREAMANEHIQQLYVEYRFPGVPLSETETPLSLRKPRGGEEIYFHFSKVIVLDPEGSSTQRELLFSMLQAEEAGQSRLRFVVVSEPLPGAGGECEDVGFAYVDLREILLTGRDVLERDLDVVSPQEPGSAIGKLKVSVEAAAALCAIYWEGRRKAEEE